MSTFFSIYSNLDVREAVNGTYAASTTIYDSKGAPHTLTVDFVHDGLVGGVDQWSWAASIPDADIAGGAAGAGAVDNGTITFDGTGTLVGATNIAGAVAIPGNMALQQIQNFANGSDDLDITWNLVDGNNIPQITGYPLPSSTTSTNTDGYPPGSLTSLVVGADGIIQGVFTNGTVQEMAQLAIGQFNSPKGLLRVGRNLFSATNASGDVSLGAADTGGRGSVVGSSLEASNVDMAVEFTQMLVYERGYQANSKIISASDTVTQTAINLVR